VHVQGDCSTEDFLNRLKDHDSEMEKLREEAERSGEVRKAFAILIMLYVSYCNFYL
jgi:hypothetical protein